MKKKCIQKCGRVQHARGLCGTCLTAAARLIAKGQHTEKELVAAGVMLPKQVNGSAERRILRKLANAS